MFEQLSNAGRGATTRTSTATIAKTAAWAAMPTASGTADCAVLGPIEHAADTEARDRIETLSPWTEHCEDKHKTTERILIIFNIMEMLKTFLCSILYVLYSPTDLLSYV
jgi:hypothetical protein